MTGPTEIPEEDESGSDAAASLDLGAFAAAKLDEGLRVGLLILLHTAILLLWFGTNIVLHRVAGYVESQGNHERCVFVLQDVAPWGILCIALLYLAKDVLKAVKGLLRYAFPKR